MSVSLNVGISLNRTLTYLFFLLLFIQNCAVTIVLKILIVLNPPKILAKHIGEDHRVEWLCSVLRTFQK